MLWIKKNASLSNSQAGEQPQLEQEKNSPIIKIKLHPDYQIPSQSEVPWQKLQPHMYV